MLLNIPCTKMQGLFKASCFQTCMLHVPGCCDGVSILPSGIAMAYLTTIILSKP